MKKSLFALMTLAFCLTACTPAESTIPESDTTPASAEAAMTEEPAETQTGTFQVAGELRDVSDTTLQENTLYDVQYGDSPEDTTFVAVDFQTGQLTPICQLEDWGESFMGWLVKGEVFYYLIYDKEGNAILHSRVLTDGSETEWRLAVGKEYPAFVDDQYLYFVQTDYTGYNAMMKRVNLTTGELEDLPLPALTASFQDVEGSQFLITRVLTPMLVNASPQGDNDQYEALMQNAEIEYSWWDPATGTVDKVLQEPYYGEKDAQGNWVTRIYLGKAEGKLYFYRASIAQTGMQGSRVERCNLDGSQVETVFSLPEGAGAPSGLKKEGQLHWLLQPTSSGLTVYVVATGETLVVGSPAGMGGFCPDRCLPGNQLLLSQKDGSYRVVTETDYLAGVFTGTTIPAL